MQFNPGETIKVRQHEGTIVSYLAHGAPGSVPGTLRLRTKGGQVLALPVTQADFPDSLGKTEPQPNTSAVHRMLRGPRR